MTLDLYYIVEMIGGTVPRYISGPYGSYANAMDERDKTNGCFAPNIEIVCNSVEVE